MESGDTVLAPQSALLVWCATSWLCKYGVGDPRLNTSAVSAIHSRPSGLS